MLDSLLRRDHLVSDSMPEKLPSSHPKHCSSEWPYSKMMVRPHLCLFGGHCLLADDIRVCFSLCCFSSVPVVSMLQYQEPCSLAIRAFLFLLYLWYSILLLRLGKHLVVGEQMKPSLIWT